MAGINGGSEKGYSVDTQYYFVGADAAPAGR